MGQTGLTNSEEELCDTIAAQANRYWREKDRALLGKISQPKVDKVCKNLQKLFVQATESDNFHLLVAAERTLCNADFDHFQDQQQTEPDDFPPDGIMRSLQEGAERMDEISRKLDVRAKDTETFHRYSSYTLMEKGDHDGDGLPKDGIRKILSGHKTRLNNRSKAYDGLSREERNLMRLRQANIPVAERLYKAMQRKVLIS